MYRVEFYAAVRRSVYVEGLSERAAARRFGLARETVRKMLLDRLTHHVHILELNGDSYRLAHSKHARKDAAAPAS